MKRLTELTSNQRFLLGVIIDVLALVVIGTLALNDAITGATALTAIAGIVVGRRPPHEIGKDDDDESPPSSKTTPKRKPRKSASGAISGLLTLIAGVLWIGHLVSKHRRGV